MSKISSNDSFELEDINKLADVASHMKTIERRLFRYQLIFEYVSEAIEICDEAGNVLYFNKKFLEVSNLLEEERLGKNILEVNPDGLLAQVLTTREPIFNAVKTFSGTKGHRMVDCYPLFHDEEFIGAVIFEKDYSQAIQLSQKLSEREIFLKELYRQTAKYSFSDIISNNLKMKDIIAVSRQMAMNDDPVVLIGEVGTGKDILTQAIHSASQRNKKPFFKFNCAKFSTEKIDHELFGYEKNSFPEALTNKIGLLELVNGGTLYLQNLQELPVSSQSKLIQSLKDNKTYKIGALESMPINVRVMASLNVPVQDYWNNGLMNKELIHYLGGNYITLPPLKDRIEDLPDLVHSFISKISKNTGKHVKGIRPEALELLKKYSWPGNVSELESVVRMIIVTLDKDLITLDHVLSRLPAEFNEKPENRVMPLEEVEKICILNALKVYGDSLSGKKQAAEELQISLGTLYNKMKKYNLYV